MYVSKYGHTIGIVKKAEINEQVDEKIKRHKENRHCSLNFKAHKIWRSVRASLLYCTFCKLTRARSQLAALSTLLQSARSALFICPNGRERDRYVRLELSANDFLRQLIVFVCLVVDAGAALLQPSPLFCFTRARL